MDTPQNALEAIEFMIDTNVHRYNRKQIACMLRPKLKPETAKVWLTNCLNPEGEQHFHPDDVDRICEITGKGDIYLNYFADQHGFEKVSKKVILDPANEVIILRQALIDRGEDPSKVTKDVLKEHKGLLALSLKKKNDD